jgi:hypothetical protein
MRISTLFGMTSGAAVSRYQATITFTGEGSRVETNGVNLLKGKQHADTTLFMDHAVPHCDSREVFRAGDRRSRPFGVPGPHHRPSDAQKTDAKMMTRALLLSDEAEADNKPELEIFADDVTCGHGATSGALDESPAVLSAAPAACRKRRRRRCLIQAFRRRGHRIHRERRPARNRCCRRASLAGGTGMTMHPAVANGSYDVAAVREDFPALALKVYGKPLVYLDNAASAQKPTAVLKRMTDAYESEYAKVHRGLHLPRQCRDGSL